MLVRRSKTISKKPLLVLEAVELSTYSGYGKSVEGLPAKQLARRGIAHTETPARNDITLCLRKMQGFINVTIETDDIRFVTENNTRKYDKPKTIVQGELATRTGSRLIHYGQPYSNENCLPAVLPFTKPVRHLANDLRQTASLSQLLAVCGAIYQTMREQIPFDAKWKFLWSKI